MSLIALIRSFFESIFSVFYQKSSKPPDSNNGEVMILPITIQENEADAKEEKVDVSRRTLLTRLYVMKQQIEAFKQIFPSEYNRFLEKIQEIEESYEVELEESHKELAWQIDPEKNSKKVYEVEMLEKQIRRFMDKELKFYIISKRLQTLITKLNVLYNVSIFHSSESDRSKVLSQIEKAKSKELEIVQEFTESDDILEDKRLKERIVILLNYTDYLIFKAILRNSNKEPKSVWEDLVSKCEFTGVEPKIFIPFCQSELSNLKKLLKLAKKEIYKMIHGFEKKIEEIEGSVSLLDIETTILSSDFWKKIFDIESNVLFFLEQEVKEKAKIEILKELYITVDETEVIKVPKNEVQIYLSKVYLETYDERVWLMIKLLSNISDDVKCKELYYIAVLLDIADLFKNASDGIAKCIKTYAENHPYEGNTLKKRKEKVKNSSESEKKYTIMFYLDEEANRVITILEKLNIDYRKESNGIYINAFYFKGLDNIKAIRKKT